jgi:hypothetical protein
MYSEIADALPGLEAKGELRIMAAFLRSSASMSESDVLRSDFEGLEEEWWW